MSELEDMIGEVKSNRSYDALEMEFIHTRAKGLQYLLQLLDSKQEAAGAEKVEENERVEKSFTPETEAVREPEPEPEPGPQPIETAGKSDARDEKKPEAGMKEPETPTEPEITEGHDEKAQQEPEKEERDGDMLEEEKEQPGKKTALGDSFLKGKSVNDLIQEKHKLEYKLSNRPVSSIQAAIGINDRFQYIRELFGGDSDAFVETVRALDEMQNIHEAVDYLRTHFKWKKNETSLKFVNLVKRRFQNE